MFQIKVVESKHVLYSVVFFLFFFFSFFENRVVYEIKVLLRFHCNSGSANAPKWYMYIACFVVNVGVQSTNAETALCSLYR